MNALHDFDVEFHPGIDPHHSGLPCPEELDGVNVRHSTEALANTPWYQVQYFQSRRLLSL